MGSHYGLQIGVKFNFDGTPIRYPGNSIIADIQKETPAYAVLHHISRQLKHSEFSKCLILLPETSYHVTIIRGMNDNVRKAEFWPPMLAMDTPMEKVDEYFAAAAGEVSVFKSIRMKYMMLHINDEDVRVCLEPADQLQNKILKNYRNQVADHLGYRLPGHENYTCHVTLAYILKSLLTEYPKEVDQIVKGVNAYLKEQNEFYLSTPYLAYYNDMMQFHSQRLPRR